jgi:ubiquinone biosynthesis accessory factor UbiK
VKPVETGAPQNNNGFARLLNMTLDELTAQIKALLAGNPGEDLQKNLRATLAAGLSRMDVVSKQEFDVQREMLNVLRAQVDDLTAQVEALEKKNTA